MIHFKNQNVHIDTFGTDFKEESVCLIRTTSFLERYFAPC